MSKLNRPAGVNRTLIGLTGIISVAAGAYALAAHFGQLGWVDRDSTLVPGSAAPPTGVFVAVIAGAVILGLLCLRWLFAQIFRMPKARSWRLEADESTGKTVMASSTAAAPVAADIAAFDDVRSASAWLTGTRWAPQLHLTVTAEPHTDVGLLRGRILDEAVPRLRQALEVETIPVTLELSFADAGERPRLG
ncbi:alkaline shock response membrane anchor protein AmaP [Nocardia cyriacigeorgica]|uniref:Alkaline shock response membrane anchor protein AmaP n=1 Tax=Nocardia cyriacigeorgica TaxID=135487 RepID=A0A6P1D5U6_9NOCA|nr:alkaline shock response membrane anchor protein AmaP [Nocardia cyriacigeorgica]NEW40946.1 alkaline shock response membrane anchor protein AmaP [Nocardia cyriacigeorgica]NEW44253.1 alkaline shock response membrane anchor protein AmaP [Nocardia cyriacigeorgica]NEW51248.1 alkaline shock response membrane anchor protein AmaP [Nocardia cyriacigeorgica]NEW59155.1 alkaline shock response membrane anchor protein AmaP [Nocardia cyriacigeorgica]